MSSNLYRSAAEVTGLTISDLTKIVSTAPCRYKVFEIPKRSGKTRVIAQPAREVKDLQYFLMDKMLSVLPVHAAATAYKKGTSIRENALAHVENEFLLKMDFSNFFGSIVPTDFDWICELSGLKLNKKDTYFCHQVLFWSGVDRTTLRLSIGAPSSPMLSNAVMMPFDTHVQSVADELQLRYTRYADDLTFSSNESVRLREVERVVSSILEKVGRPKLRINREKTVFVSKRVRRSVTGVVITNDRNISLGRDWKRNIRAAVHASISGRLDDEELDRLRGNLAYANSIEPAFVRRLSAYYGVHAIESIFKRRPVGRL